MNAIGRFKLSILAILASITWLGQAQGQPLANGYARSSTMMVGYEKKFIPWEQFDGQLVEVEGMAWGGADKGLGAHLRLAQNDEVYLENLNTTNADLDGRLLNVVGIFRKKRVEKAPPGAQGFGRSFDYYSIEVIAARKIDKVEQYQVLPARGEWIVKGMTAAEALQKVQARKWTPYPLPHLKPQAGTTLHSFQNNANSILLFGETQGQITGVMEYRPNDPQQQADDTYFWITGYDLAARKAAEIPQPPKREGPPPLPPGASFR